MNDDDLDDALDRAAALLAQADALVIAAGAGMGVDSGLPDFRGGAGFWTSYPALGAQGLDFVQVASPETFERDPRLAWGFYGHRLALYRRTQPHQGFAILQRWAGRMAQGGFVYTSNVDGQFQKAGFDAGRVLECHGSIHRLQCTLACSARTWASDGLEPEVDEATCRWLAEMPDCPQCGALARPNILMFGDGAWLAGNTETQEAALERWLEGVRRPVVVELGAGTQVPSVRHFGQRLRRAFGAPLLRINPRESAVSGAADVGLALGALEGLQRVDERWR